MNPTSDTTSDTTSDNLRRVLHGGSWYSNVPSRVRAASRNPVGPADRNNRLGFRCVLRGREPR